MSDMRAKYVLLGVTLAVTLGMLTAFMVPAVASPTSNVGLMMGHVTMVVTDGDGNVKHYFQSDNQVTDEGTDCAMEVLFGSADNGFNICPSPVGADFDIIALGSVAITPIETTDKADWTGTATEVARAMATDNDFTALNEVTITEKFVVADDTADVNILDVGEDIEVVALFDDVTANTANTGNMIAAFDLPSAISGLVLLDELTITWVITGGQDIA